MTGEAGRSGGGTADGEGKGIGDAFLLRSRALLAEAYLPRIRRCLDRLPAEDLWWRPNEASNSVGNLVLHLVGNVRQWICAGVGDAPDTRNRAEEFERRSGATASVLLAVLEDALHDADRVLDGLGSDDLSEVRSIQGRQVTVLDAVYHVVEHFAMHTGQIVYVTKERTDRDLAFYRMEEGIPRENF